jgi:CBS domain-containing protein
MTRNPICVDPDDDMVVAARLLIAHGVQSLPVVSEGRVVGMVSRMDLLRCLNEHPDCCNPVRKTD